MNWELLKIALSVAAIGISAASLVISLRARRATIASSRAMLNVRKVEILQIHGTFIELNFVLQNIGKSTAHTIKLFVRFAIVVTGTDEAPLSEPIETDVQGPPSGTRCGCWTGISTTTAAIGGLADPVSTPATAAAGVR